jgi:hypothetical protein
VALSAVAAAKANASFFITSSSPPRVA